jgi:hypothetical protein
MFKYTLIFVLLGLSNSGKMTDRLIQSKKHLISGL